MLTSIDMSHQRLYHLLSDENTIWVLYLDIVKFLEVEFRYGYQTCRQILTEIDNEINLTLRKQRNLFLFTQLESRGGDDFVVYFAPLKNTHWEMKDVIEQGVLSMEERFNRRLKKLVNEKISLRCGLARKQDN